MNSPYNRNEITSIFLELISRNSPNIEETYQLTLEGILELYRNSGDTSKFQFLPVGEIHLNPEIPFKGVFYLTHEEELLKVKQQDANQMKKTKKQNKISYEPEIYEKFPISPSCNEKLKIVTFNPTFDKLIRHNMVEWMFKYLRFEGIDRDEVKERIEEIIKSIEPDLYSQIAAKHGVDLFEHNIHQILNISEDKNEDAENKVDNSNSG